MNRLLSGLETWLNCWSQMIVIIILTFSCWLVMIAALQGSALVPLLFKTFINDMDDDRDCNVNQGKELT